MMEETTVATDESYDSLDEQDGRPAERWAPLGAADSSSPGPGSHEETPHNSHAEQLNILEAEQEHLNNSLLSLTTHFAQVQFRLKQIVNAPAEHKEDLLQELEQFAFRGIPDMNSYSKLHGEHTEEDDTEKTCDESEYESKMTEQREKQLELISQLKEQLEDLETYAYQTGDATIPTTMVMEKQRVIIDQLRNKLDIDLNDMDQLSNDDLKQCVDKAIGQIVNPAKVKEKLVDQLKTQIVDLERFVSFLQGEATSPGPLGDNCSCPVHEKTGDTKDEHHNKESQKAHRETLSLMKQALTMLQLFAITQFGCGSKDFQKNVLKKTEKGNHWGDLRAELEVSIEEVLAIVQDAEQNKPEDTDYTSDSEDAPVVQCNQALVTAVRKDLAMSLRNLMQHGLMEMGQSQSLMPFGCFPNRGAPKDTKVMHVWELFLKYYEMKHGKEYNDSPARKLSESFHLDIIGSKAITAKQTLLSAVHTVLSSHAPLKRSDDSMFKAFVCLALNEKKLVPWLRLLFRTSTLIEFYYQPWSYTMKTGFDDSLVSLERLTKHDYNLPVDLAVRPFKNIKDAF